MKIKTLAVSFAAAATTLLLSTDSAGPRNDARPVAILATGTNGGTDVQRDTEQLITRIQNAGYRVVVVAPRNSGPESTADQRNLYPRHAAVMAAARSRGVEAITPKTWEPDGFHVGRADALAIGQRYAGAPTFGDSNSVIINNVTKGHCMGVSGMQTHDMLTTQFPPATSAPTAQRQSCRSLAAVLGR